MRLPSENWFYARAGEKAGPVTLSQLRLLFFEGHLDRETDLVWADGVDDWKPASRIPGLLEDSQPLAGAATPLGGPGRPYIKRARFGLLLLCFGLGPLLAGAGLAGIYWGWFNLSSVGYEPLSRVLTVLSAVAIAAAIGLTVVGIVFGCTYLFRAWLMLQPYGAPLTPGLAVFLLFIPIFNLYWAFQALWGWARTYNRVIKNDPTFQGAPEVNAYTFLAFCCVLIVRVFARLLLGITGTFHPVFLSISLLCNLAMLVLGLVCAYQICAAVNSFANLEERPGFR